MPIRFLDKSARLPMMSSILSRKRLVDFFLPLLTIGGSALSARLLASDDGSQAFYLAPLAVAVLIGLSRPSLLGSVGAWLGWSAGVALGWLIDAGDLWFMGPAAYGLLLAFLPHALASLARASLSPDGKDRELGPPLNSRRLGRRFKAIVASLLLLLASLAVGASWPVGAGRRLHEARSAGVATGAPSASY